jgi:uncharacterized membrane protein
MSFDRRRIPDFSLARILGAGGFALVLFTSPSMAKAELKLCNSTSSKIGVAIGYRDPKEGWTSEGWWNVDSQSCALLIQDKLRARYYYIYAFDYDKGGEWGGPIPMCTQDSEFTIRGIGNCDGRGFKKSGFFEVDTKEQSDWTVKLTDQSPPQAPVAGGPAPAVSPVAANQSAVGPAPAVAAQPNSQATAAPSTLHR